MTPKNRLISIFVVLVVAIGLSGFECDIEARSKIAGTVYIDGRPQAYGTVQAWKDGEMVSQVRCTQTGHYTIADLEAGTYKLIYLNAQGVPLGRETVVEARLGRFEQVDIELNVQTEGLPD